MRKRILAIGLVIVVPGVAVGGQVASAEVRSIVFHDDLRFIAAQIGENIGTSTPKTDEQVQEEVVTSAADDGIHLQPEQVKLQRITILNHTSFDITVSYTMRVRLPYYSFDLHFNPTSAE